jgi:hypothetical protein
MSYTKLRVERSTSPYRAYALAPQQNDDSLRGGDGRGEGAKPGNESEDRDHGARFDCQTKSQRAQC